MALIILTWVVGWSLGPPNNEKEKPMATQLRG